MGGVGNIKVDAVFGAKTTRVPGVGADWKHAKEEEEFFVDIFEWLLIKEDTDDDDDGEEEEEWVDGMYFGGVEERSDDDVEEEEEVIVFPSWKIVWECTLFIFWYFMNKITESEKKDSIQLLIY